MATTADLQRVIDVPLRRGEARSLTITGSFAASPAAWATEFRMLPEPGDDSLVVEVGAASVSGSGPYTGVFTVQVDAADSADLLPGLHSWTLWRTDDGSAEVLAAGTWLVL